MLFIASILAKSIMFFILCGCGFGFLIISYGVLRTLHISVHRVTWLAGGLVIAASALVCLAVARPGLLPARINEGGKVVGAIAVLVGVYAAGQWATRQWYIKMKKDAGRWLKQGGKEVLMFLRKHHMFFGWVVVAGSAAHMVFFFPIFARFGLYETLTGFGAIGILALMALLGTWLWIQTSLRKQRMPRVIHTVHASLTIAFFVMLFLHI